MNLPWPERFWAKVNKHGSLPNSHSELGWCWLWIACCDKDGYGQFSSAPYASQRAHRIAYEMAYGPIPAGLEIDHLCQTRRCVNPAHLEATSGRTNTLRSRSVSARYAARTHCDNGHPYDDANTRVDGNRRRTCRACDRERHELMLAQPGARARFNLAHREYNRRAYAKKHCKCGSIDNERIRS